MTFILVYHKRRFFMPLPPVEWKIHQKHPKHLRHPTKALRELLGHPEETAATREATVGAKASELDALYPEIRRAHSVLEQLNPVQIAKIRGAILNSRKYLFSDANYRNQSTRQEALIARERGFRFVMKEMGLTDETTLEVLFRHLILGEAPVPNLK